MAKLGQYTYPDIRFGDAVEISGRILSKFKGTVSVKGLAWELGMAEGSGTLFAKVAALRDFGLVEGRGELRVSALAQRVLHPTNADEGHSARAEAFQRVDLLRQLYQRFEGEVPDDMSMLVGLEEITRAARDEIVRRAPLIQKHLTDAIRVLGRPVVTEKKPEYSGQAQNIVNAPEKMAVAVGNEDGIQLSAGGRHLSVPLRAEYIDVAISLLRTLRTEMDSDNAEMAEYEEENLGEAGLRAESEPRPIEDIEMGVTDQLGSRDDEPGLLHG